MSVNWVMRKQNGEIEPLEGESILLKSPGHVSFDLRVPSSLRTPNSNFTLKCDDGALCITNQRIIYLANPGTKSFQSFSAFILDTYDPQPQAGGWMGFGAWRWKAEAKPRPAGGIPADIPRVEITFIFNQGGIDAFHSKYSQIYERLSHARDIARETGTRITVHDDELPPYTPADTGNGLGTYSAPTQPESLQTTTVSQPADQSHPMQSRPNEPPPGYDEAQAQAVEQQFDEREQQGAERAQ